MNSKTSFVLAAIAAGIGVMLTASDNGSEATYVANTNKGRVVPASGNMISADGRILASRSEDERDGDFLQRLLEENPNSRIRWEGDLYLDKLTTLDGSPSAYKNEDGVWTGNANPGLRLEKAAYLHITGDVICANDWQTYFQLDDFIGALVIDGDVYTAEYKSVVLDVNAPDEARIRRMREQRYFVPLEPKYGVYAYKGHDQFGGFATSGDKFYNAYKHAVNNAVDTSRLSYGGYDGPNGRGFPQHRSEEVKDTWGVHNGFITHDAQVILVADNVEFNRNGRACEIIVKGKIAGFRQWALAIGSFMDHTNTKEGLRAVRNGQVRTSINVQDCYHGAVLNRLGENVVHVNFLWNCLGHYDARRAVEDKDSSRVNDPGYGGSVGRAPFLTHNTYINGTITNVKRKGVESHNASFDVLINVIIRSQAYGVSVAFEEQYRNRASDDRAATFTMIACDIKGWRTVHCDNGQFNAARASDDPSDDATPLAGSVDTIACRLRGVQVLLNQYPRAVLNDHGSSLFFEADFDYGERADVNWAYYAPIDVGATAERGTQVGINLYGTKVYNTAKGNAAAAIIARGKVASVSGTVHYDPRVFSNEYAAGTPFYTDVDLPRKVPMQALLLGDNIVNRAELKLIDITDSNPVVVVKAQNETDLGFSYHEQFAFARSRQVGDFTNELAYELNGSNSPRFSKVASTNSFKVGDVKHQGSSSLTDAANLNNALTIAVADDKISDQLKTYLKDAVIVSAAYEARGGRFFNLTLYKE